MKLQLAVANRADRFEPPAGALLPPAGARFWPRSATTHHFCWFQRVICPVMSMQKRCEVGHARRGCHRGQPSRPQVAQCANPPHAARKPAAHGVAVEQPPPPGDKSEPWQAENASGA